MRILQIPKKGHMANVKAAVLSMHMLFGPVFPILFTLSLIGFFKNALV